MKAILLYIIGLPVLIGASALAEGIPEPSLVLYGAIRNQALWNVRQTNGTLVWIFKRSNDGPVVACITNIVTNVLNQFSFVLMVPCETLITGNSSPNTLGLQPLATLFDRSEVIFNGQPVKFVDTNQWIINLRSQDRGLIERVDLLVSIPCETNPVSGFCIEWEQTYFGYVGVERDEDADGDGLSNWCEFIAGTNPVDATSFFAFINIEVLPSSGILLNWASVEGRQYRLFRYASLVSSNAMLVVSNLLATPPVNSFYDTNALPPGPYFYQLIIEP